MPWDGTVPCHPYDRAGIVYVEVPRCGSTSLKHMLAPMLGHLPEPERLDVHHWTGYTHARNRDELGEWLSWRWRDYLRVTMVRHPLARFESFFYGMSLRPGLEVNEFVATDTEHWQDIHGTPQLDIIGDPSWYDVVGRLEDPARLVGSLGARLHTNFELPHVNTSRGRERVPMTAATLEAVQERYREDLRVLEYDPEVWA